MNMTRLKRLLLLAVLLVGVLSLGMFLPGAMQVYAQQPTGSIPTVTGTVEGPTVRVDPFFQQIRVYAGPSSLGEYPAIGILLANETAPALARAQGEAEWIQIYYPGVPGGVGWVFARYVFLSPGANLKVISAPATSTPRSTPTIDPTLVAVFIGQPTSTRLPTFTPPPPLELPQFTDTSTATDTAGIPTGLLVIVFGLFGVLGVVLSYLRSR
jgi:hypothetical protein